LTIFGEFGESVFKNWKTHNFFVILRNCLAIFLEIKIINLITSRPGQFLGYHLQQHSCKNVITHLGQSLFNTN
jgi:hypothetical protein